MKPSYEELEVMLQDALDKIKASQEQEPVYQVWKYKDPCSEYRQWCDCSETEYNEASHTKRKLYAQPPLPPELAELQRANERLLKDVTYYSEKLTEITRRHCDEIDKNAELRKLLKSEVPLFRILGDGLRIDMNYLCLGEKRGITQHICQQVLISALRADELVQDTCAQMYAELCKPLPTPQPKEPKQSPETDLDESLRRQ